MEPSSDIYNVNEPPWAKAPVPRKKRRRPRVETYDEAVHKDVSATHRRRSRNSGFRRFRHLMKNPEFSKKFWAISLGTAGLILLVLVVWDLFLRYPAKNTDETPSIYRVEVE